VPEVRGRLVPVVVAGLASGGLAAIAGNQDWASIDRGGDATATAFSSAAASTLDATAPPVTALALVLLATWGVVLVSRGRARLAVTWLGLLAALGVVGFAVAAWLATPGNLVDVRASVEVAASRTVWSYVGVLAALVASGTSVLAVRSVGRWPEMGRRYDAPGDGTAAPPPAVPLEEQTNLDLWRAIDDGRDPTTTTDGPTDGVRH
jgi:uncharacterized membrane protein